MATETESRNHYRVWLTLLIVGYFGVSLALSILRWLQFETTNWDLGIFQQALWSTSHGRLLWEAGDYEFYSAQSFLQVHPSPLLLVLVPIYALAPSAVTLFVIQSAVVAAAALPLAALAEDISGSKRMGLVAAALYLVQAPVLGATLYDFHLEAFFPLEVFLLVLLWSRRRYFLVVLVSALTMITLEVGPILVASVALFFIAPDVVPVFGRLWVWLKALRSHGSVADARRALLTATAAPGFRFGVGIFVASVVGYVALRLFQYDVLELILGVSPQGSAAASIAPSGIGISIANLAAALPEKLTYWILVYAMVAFLPFRVPRTLLPTVPWCAYTLLSSNVPFVTFGFQYGFVTTAVVILGVPYALRDVPFGGIWESFRAWVFSRRGSARGQSSTPHDQHAPAHSALWSFALLAAIALNLALSPVNPAIQGNYPGNGYNLAYRVPSGFSEVASLSTLIIPGSYVLASTDLFPFVANNVHAYSLLWYASPPPYLPFNGSNPPTYVLMSQDQGFAVPTWLTPLLYSSTYGVRGVVWQTPVGTVLLFEKGWHGSSEAWSASPRVPVYYSGSALGIGAAGSLVRLAGTPFPEAIESRLGATGTVWYGPYASLAPGNYTVTTDLEVSSQSSSVASDSIQPVLHLEVGAYAVGNWVNRSYTLYDLGGGTPYRLTLPIMVRSPVVDVEVRGYQISSDVVVTLYYVLFAPA